jgi:NAD(P)-dependent dehydrogenase (short-subunit alcohol dehydrogenase family)
LKVKPDPGKELSRGLACAGATVVISGRREDRLVAAAEEINTAVGREACFTVRVGCPRSCRRPHPPSPPLHAASPNPWPRQVQHDVSDLSSAETLIEKASAAGGGAVTILVNNAGLNVRKPAEALCAPAPPPSSPQILSPATRRSPAGGTTCQIRAGLERHARHDAQGALFPRPRRGARDAAGGVRVPDPPAPRTSLNRCVFEL